MHPPQRKRTTRSDGPCAQTTNGGRQQRASTRWCAKHHRRHAIETLSRYRAKDRQEFQIPVGQLPLQHHHTLRHQQTLEHQRTPQHQQVDRTQISRPSSRSVTNAAIGLRSLRVKVMWAKSGWPLSASMTAATPSWRPTRRLSRWATSWVRTTLEFWPILESTVSSTLRSRDCASSTMTKASCNDRPRMWVNGMTSNIPRSIISSTTSVETRAPSVSKTACPQGPIFSVSLPGR